MKTGAAFRGNQAGGSKLFCLIGKTPPKKTEINWTDSFLILTSVPGGPGGPGGPLIERTRRREGDERG